MIDSFGKNLQEKYWVGLILVKAFQIRGKKLSHCLIPREHKPVILLIYMKTLPLHLLTNHQVSLKLHKPLLRQSGGTGRIRSFLERSWLKCVPRAVSHVEGDNYIYPTLAASVLETSRSEPFVSWLHVCNKSNLRDIQSVVCGFSCLGSVNLQVLLVWQIYKAQRNVVLCAAGILLYWYIHQQLSHASHLYSWIDLYSLIFTDRCIHHICKYNKDLEHLEELEKRYKAE